MAVLISSSRLAACLTPGLSALGSCKQKDDTWHLRACLACRGVWQLHQWTRPGHMTELADSSLQKGPCRVQGSHKSWQ